LISTKRLVEPIGWYAAPDEGWIDMNMREVVQAYFDRLNAEDWDGLGELFHPDAELWAPGFPRTKGREQVTKYFRSALSIYPEHYDDPVRVVVAGDTATINIHYEGKLANGYRLSFDAVDVFDFRDGLIYQETSWYDSHEVRRALLQGRALNDGPEGERSRIRLALADVQGRANGLGGRWSNGAAPAALCLPAVLVAAEGELTVERAAQEPAGWALLVRGADAIAPGALAGRPAGGCDRELAVDGETPWIVELSLDGIEPGPGALVATSGPDGAANAVFLA
jgi:ketosteroid isomerase-like protein